MYRTGPSVHGMLARERSAQATKTSTPAAKSPKFPDPPFYEGDSEKLKGWLASVRRSLVVCGVDLDSARAVVHACMFFRGKAMEWWTAQEELEFTGQIEPIATWAQFVDAVTAQFQSGDLVHKHTLELLHLTQGKQDIRNFVSTFNAARGRVPGAVNEATLKSIFLHALNRPEMRSALLLLKPKTVTDLIEAAVVYAEANPGGTTPSIPKKTENTPKNSGTPAKTRPHCDHCHKSGHTAATCFQPPPRAEGSAEGHPQEGGLR